MKRAVNATLFFAALVVAWQAMVWSGRWSPVLLPSPGSVAGYLWTALLDGSLAEATLVTLRRLLVGYAIGVVIGLPLGLLSSRSEFMEDTVGVLALGLQTLPSVCWIPLALLWFGQSESAMVFVGVMGTAWSVVIATDTGARSIPPVYTRAARTMATPREKAARTGPPPPGVSGAPATRPEPIEGDERYSDLSPLTSMDEGGRPVRGEPRGFGAVVVERVSQAAIDGEVPAKLLSDRPCT